MRVDIKKIMSNSIQRKKILVRVIMATQAREGIDTTQGQAEVAYDKILQEVKDGRFNGTDN